MAPQIGVVVMDRTLPFLSFALLGYTWYCYVFRVCISTIYNTFGKKAEAGTVGTFYLIVCIIYNYEPPVSLCLTCVGHRTVVFITVACIFWLLALWSYVVVLMTGPGTPEKDFPQPIQPPPLAVANEVDYSQINGGAPTLSYSPASFDMRTMQQLPVSTVSPSSPLMSVAQHDGRSRYCEHCQCIKPDRAHHCRECDSCTLRMDHHCPWVSGCVGHGNYKFFFLFVLYTALYSIWVFGTTLPTIIIAVVHMGNPVDIQWIVCVVLAFLWGFLLLAFSCIHGYYILTNTTTIEYISDRPYFIRVDYDRSGHNYQLVSTDIGVKLWSLGMAANWRSVMGNSPWGWFFPIRNVLGNGFTYPFDPHVYQNMVERAAQQSRMSTAQSQLPNDSSLPTFKSPPTDSNHFAMHQRNGSASELLV